MLRKIALTTTGLAFCLLMFVYLLNAPEQAATVELRAVAPASVAAPAEVALAPVTNTPAPVVVEAVATVAPSPLPSPSVEERIVRLLEENNRGITTPVSISRMMDTITVRWALNDRDTGTMLAEADRRMVEAVGVLGDQYRLINFEGTFSLVYPDGRKAEEVVLWATYEDGRQVSRKVAPVLGME
jgi:hypothetical protein